MAPPKNIIPDPQAYARIKALESRVRVLWVCFLIVVIILGLHGIGFVLELVADAKQKTERVR